jgi:hypothetical protein
MIKFFRKIRYDLMVKNKTGKYLKYAIGEIILVVIGILIALQINTWNTENDNKKIVLKNSKTLIENLQKDSIHLLNIKQVMARQEKVLLDFKERLSKNTATIDTLIKIARFEFRPSVQVTSFPNDNAYNTMVLSGEINLFDRELTQNIYDLYRDHELLGKVADDNFATYTQAVETYLSRYSFNVSGNSVITGHLQDELWKDVDAKDLIAKFNKLVGTKRLSYSRKKGSETLLNETSLLLEKLREIEN